MKKYDIPMETSRDMIPGKIMEQIKQGSSVLEFGCAFGRMTKYLKETLRCKVCIVEIDVEAFQVASNYAKDGFCGDIDQDGWFKYFSDCKFDYIIFADVLEHLRNPLQALIRSNKLLNEDGKILISIPNIGHNDILIKLFNNRFDYTSIGLLDSTHIHFWGKNNLESFVREAGLGICVLDGVYQLSQKTEQKIDKEMIPVQLQDILAQRHYNDVYQFFLVLQKQEWIEKNGISCVNNLYDSLNNLNIYCYWDFGDGYKRNKNRKMKPCITKEGLMEIYCDDIPKNCIKVRFDPPLNYYCLISNVCVMTNVSSCSIYPLNGVTVNGVCSFSNKNPQMEFVLPEGAEWFKITFNMNISSDNDFGKVISSLNNFNEKEEIWHNKLTTIQKDFEEKLNDAQKEIKDVNEKLVEAQSISDKKTKRLKSLLKTKEEDLKEETTRVEVLKQQLIIQKNQNMNLKFQAQQLPGLVNQVNELTRIINVIQNERDSFKNSYDEIREANCWKITAPLRRFLDAVRSTKDNQQNIKETTELNIKNYPKTLSGMAQMIKDLGGKTINDERFFDFNIGRTKKILLVSHELSLTGAPIALQALATTVKEMGFFPIFISPIEGGLSQQLESEDFPVLILNSLFSSSVISEFKDLFDLIVVNTIVGAPIVSELCNTRTPVLWWIHEAQVSYHLGAVQLMPEQLTDNIHVFCVGEYAKKLLHQHRPSYHVNELLYSVNDYSNNTRRKRFKVDNPTNKTVFVTVGTLEKRKGHSVLIKAIRLMNQKILKKCLFVFVGKPHEDAILEEILVLAEEFPQNIKFIPQLNRLELFDLYKQSDCLICSSLDDPMPIVVTEAMICSKPIICSKNTGSASLLSKMKAGLIYSNDNPSKLAKCIEDIYGSDKETLEEMGRRLRLIYEKFFTPKIFKKSLHDIFKEIIPQKGEELYFCDETVSIIVPTYNGENDLRELIPILQSQQNVKCLEIIIIDSESKDNSTKVAKEMNAKVIEITQKEFSHSFARNLGAEVASGKYLLFMTQDARPSSSLWLSSMLQPIISKEAQAVSCIQLPKKDCDLFGRIAIWNHAKFMGFLENDLIMKLPNSDDYISLRKNSQLDDVSCLISKNLFLNFRYRGNYAEDLDLGLRLIREGYTLKTLCSAPVIHSHTRPPIYQFKRTLVDNKTLKTILPQMPLEHIDSRVLVSRTIYGYCGTVLFLRHKEMTNMKDGWLSYQQWCTENLSKVKQQLKNVDKKYIKSLINSGKEFFGEEIMNFLNMLLDNYFKNIKMDCTLLEENNNFLLNLVPQYYKAQGISFDKQTYNEILVAIPKNMAQLLGLQLVQYELSYPDERNVIKEKINEFTKGI